MREIVAITTDASKNQYWDMERLIVSPQDDFIHVVNLYPELREQRIEGFGGAFTEAAATSFASLTQQAKEDFLEGYFGESGLGYRLGRISMNSCDFSLENYTYVKEGDQTLESFDISHDRAQILPLVKEAARKRGESLSLLISPWSPPGYMKTNGEMNHGGRLKEECRDLWARYYVRYLTELKKEGLTVRYLTVQNEPEAVQSWDSCVYTGREEGDFAARYLAPSLKEAGFSDVEIFLWDHNKDNMYERARESFNVPGCREAVSGIAVHWYTGDHFDAIRAVKKAYPEKRVFFTEGCVEYSRFGEASEVEQAQMYAHDMLGNLKAGTEAFIDWNLLLDENGGPNHAGNYCAAPVMCDGNGGLEKRLSYYYIGQFSRYILPGAVQIATSCYSQDLETVGFENPDGSRGAVLLNRSAQTLPVYLREGKEGVSFSVEPHSIKTLLYK